MTDRQAIQRFHELVWPCRAVVLRTARIICGNEADAEDLAQDTMLKAFKGLSSFHEGTDVKAWLMAILRNSWIDRLRSCGASAQDISLDQAGVDPVDVSEPSSTEPEELWHDPQKLLNAFSDQQVIDALQAVPDEIRWTLLLVTMEGLDQATVAGLLDVPLGTVKSRLHRGRHMLRETLLPIARRLRLAAEKS